MYRPIARVTRQEQAQEERFAVLRFVARESARPELVSRAGGVRLAVGGFDTRAHIARGVGGAVANRVAEAHGEHAQRQRRFAAE